MTEDMPPERADLVDVFYAPFVRPLGNLVVLFAQAEAEWLKLVAELAACTEKEAQRFLQMKASDAKQEIVPRAQASGIDASALGCRTWRKNRPPKGKGRPVWFGSLDKDWVPSMSGGSMTANQFEQGIATFPAADLSYSSEINVPNKHVYCCSKITDKIVRSRYT